MNFGDKLRQLRGEKGLTQPELAEAIGIEQSYLSKLENGKSLPSNDIFNRILDEFDLEIADLVGDLSQGARNKLRQVPDVAAYFNQQRQQIIGNRKRWLLASAFCVSLGLALVYAGYVNLFLPNVVYQYTSYGVIHEGESKELFRNPGGSLPRAFSIEEKDQFLDSITARRNEDYVQQKSFKGYLYNVPVEGGSRTYHLTGQTEITPWQSKLIVFVGILMAMMGLIGIILERKLAHH
ncbi:MAG: helix-turn-helix domain-containing protein [Xanthomonadales bacterium]|nr:helix-turn-helix domain-containing protein [Xanthomonadales bacterium]